MRLLPHIGRRSTTAGRAVLALGMVALGCDGRRDGDVEFVVEADVSITEGLTAGTASDSVVDGWDVHFDRYLVAFGAASIARRGMAPRTYESVTVYDLASLPGGSAQLVRMEGLADGRWDRVSFALRAPDASAIRDASARITDFEEMVSGGCTFLLDGSLSKAGGTSTPPGGATRSAELLRFRLCVPVEVTFEDCTDEGGLPGLVVPSGGAAVASFTIHGDHLFFAGFPAGAELVNRRAQWLADGDVDADGTVTRAELESLDRPTDLAVLFPSSEYALAASPIAPLGSAFEYVRAQLATQGHFQGEGECAFVLP